MMWIYARMELTYYYMSEIESCLESQNIVDILELLEDK